MGPSSADLSRIAFTVALAVGFSIALHLLRSGSRTTSPVSCVAYQLGYLLGGRHPSGVDGQILRCTRLSGRMYQTPLGVFPDRAKAEAATLTFVGTLEQP